MRFHKIKNKMNDIFYQKIKIKLKRITICIKKLIFVFFLLVFQNVMSINKLDKI